MDVRMNLREIGWVAVDWIHVAQDRVQWWVFVNTVMNLQVPWGGGDLLTS
jgi:hypothetical protein